MPGDLCILALDIASTTGWAKRHQDGEIEFGVKTFQSPGAQRDVGGFLRRYATWLCERLQDPIPDGVIFESVWYPKNPKNQTHQQTLYVLSCMCGVTELMCNIQKIESNSVREVTPIVWKKHFLGHVPKGRKEQKLATIKMANLRGFRTQNDNAADALGILDYALASMKIGEPIAGPLFTHNGEILGGETKT